MPKKASNLLVQLCISKNYFSNFKHKSRADLNSGTAVRKQFHKIFNLCDVGSYKLEPFTK